MAKNLIHTGFKNSVITIIITTYVILKFLQLEKELFKANL